MDLGSHAVAAYRHPLGPVTLLRLVVDVVAAQLVLVRGIAAAESGRRGNVAVGEVEVAREGIESLALQRAGTTALEAANLVIEAVAHGR